MKTKKLPPSNFLKDGNKIGETIWGAQQDKDGSLSLKTTYKESEEAELKNKKNDECSSCPLCNVEFITTDEVVLCQAEIHIFHKKCIIERMKQSSEEPMDSSRKLIGAQGEANKQTQKELCLACKDMYNQ